MCRWCTAPPAAAAPPPPTALWRALWGGGWCSPVAGCRACSAVVVSIEVVVLMVGSGYTHSQVGTHAPAGMLQLDPPKQTAPPTHTRKRTSGLAGASVHLSQQSPRVWLWASGSKQVASPHQLNALQGSAWNGPSTLPGRCSLQRFGV